MFDIGFSELMVIALVALVVIGPEKLPKVARTAGALFGRFQRYVGDVKADIKREIELDELKKMRDSVEAQARDLEHSIRDSARSLEQDLNRSAGALEQAVSAPVTASPPATDEHPQLQLSLPEAGEPPPKS